MELNVYEVLENFVAASTRAEKIRVLRENNSFALKGVLKGTFDPRVQFVIRSIPPYTPTDDPKGLSISSIHRELDRIYLFEKDSPRRPAGLTAKRAIEILIQMLESLEAKEAVVFSGMLLKDLKTPGLDYEIVKEAFPQILP